MNAVAATSEVGWDYGSTTRDGVAALDAVWRGMAVASRQSGRGRTAWWRQLLHIDGAVEAAGGEEGGEFTEVGSRGGGGESGGEVAAAWEEARHLRATSSPVRLHPWFVRGLWRSAIMLCCVLSSVCLVRKTKDFSRV